MGIPINVIVIEDRPADAELAMDALCEAGYDPQWQRVDTEADFLRHLDAAPDIVLADYNLPQFDTMLALQLLRERHPDVPFIIVSGTIGEEIAVNALKQGADDYLLKDRLGRLGSSVRHALEEVSLRRGKAAATAEIQSTTRHFRALIERSSDVMAVLDAQGVILYESPSITPMLGYSPEELLGRNVCDHVYTEDRPAMRAHLAELLAAPRTRVKAELRYAHKTGGWRWIDAVATNLLSDPAVEGIVVNYREVTSRKEAEAQIRFQASLLDQVRNAVISTDLEGHITYWNGFATELYQWRAEEALGQDILELVMPPGDHTSSQQILQEVISAGSWTGESLVRRKDGTTFPISIVDTLIRDPQGHPIGITGVSTDITAAKQAREELHRLSQAVEQNPIAIMIMDTAGRITYVNPRFCELNGYQLGELIGRDSTLLLQSNQMPAQDVQELQATMAAGQAWHGELLSTRKNGAQLWSRVSISPIKDSAGVITHYLGAQEDITQERLSREQIERQIQQLSALHAIDIAISGSSDLRLTLDVLLDHVTAQLDVDAADVLLLNQDSQMLEFAAGRGLRTGALRHTRLRVGEGRAAQAAFQRQVVGVPDLSQLADLLARAPELAEEQFRSFFAAPLLVKGQVKGVLEVFHRTHFQPDPAWFEFFGALAAQTAIAVDNSSLFDNLQFANTALMLAYDATIEGWSRALDLRDKETEGHSQRVTEMSIRLARTMGIPEAELVQVRRGALLHDIGKMGVPDAILLKPGPLTDEEWAIMRRHPGNAYEILSPIGYLHAALEIPYCHHEKWDGTGYPRGLQGEQIPLIARIFAIVDVWDALSSNRPYRAAWPADRVEEHLRSLSGTHFDPQVVAAFFELLAPVAAPAAQRQAILVVDDEENIVRSLARSLRDQFTVFTATSAGEAYAILSREPIALILTDQRMPGTTGVKLLAQAQITCPRVPGILMSGYTDTGPLTEALNVGNVRGFLSKPWDDAQLRQQIDKVLREL